MGGQAGDRVRDGAAVVPGRQAAGARPLVRRSPKKYARRAVVVTLDFATAAKRHEIALLLEAYRGAVNFFIRSCWVTDGVLAGSLNAETLARLQDTRLSERYKSQALRQALSVIIATKRSARALGVPPSRPHFTGGAVLDAKFVDVEDGRGSFDLVVRLSTLKPGRRITIPTRKTAMVLKWLAVPGARIVQGCDLSEDRIVLWVEMPRVGPRPVEDGIVLGADTGVAKLLVTSNGQSPEYYGREFRRLRDKVKRRQPGSAGKRRAIVERDHFINRTVNQLPWTEMSVLGIEDLRGIKRGKQRGRGKSFRRAMAPWVVRRVHERLGQKAEENRVLLVAVPAAYTSRTCPRCSTESRKNRSGERFTCIGCGYANDADFVGATNVRSLTLRFLASVESARHENCNLSHERLSVA